MRRPSPAILASIGLHAGVAVLALIGWGATRERPEVVNAVPVSIVSDVVIAAAAPDNPSEELVEDEAATAPVETPPPTPVPPPPTPETPRPTPPPPEKARTPRPTPTPAPTPPPTKREPTPPRRPPTPTPPRNEPTLDLDALSGPRRDAPPRPNARPPTGQQGTGAAPRAQGPVNTAFFNEVYEHWNVFIVCDMQGGDNLRIQMTVAVAADGRITGTPTLRNPQSSPVYQAAANEALRALREASPFNVPEGFEGGRWPVTFTTERVCRNR